MTDPSAPRRASASAPAPPLRERLARFTADTPLNLAVFRVPEEQDAPPQSRTLLAELGEGSQDLSCP